MPKYSVKKPFTVLVGVVLCLVLGVVSFLGLNTDLLPSIDLPYVVIYTVYPGATPERVELSVTKPVESAVATTTGLENMTSVSQENVSLVILEFNSATNMDSALLELSNNLDAVKGSFDSMVQSPVMMKINPDMLPVAMVSVDVDGMDIKELTEYVNSTFAPQVERQDGVATVDVVGSVADHVDIWLNQEKIDAVNDEILRAVSGELYKTKKDLDKAKKELNDAERELNAKEKETYEKLADATVQLDEGKSQLNAVTGEKTQLEAQKALLEGMKSALDGIAQLSAGVEAMRIAKETAVPTIDSHLSQLEPAKEGVDALAGMLGNFDMSADTATVGMLKNAMAMMGQDTSQLDTLIASGLATEGTTVAQLQRSLDSQINELNSQKNSLISQYNELSAQKTAAIATLTEQFNNLGLDTADIEAAERFGRANWQYAQNSDLFAENAYTGMTAALDELQIELNKATLLAEQLESTVKRLQETQKQLETGKMQAAASLAVVKTQIADGKSQLESGISQFNSARDSALKQANIDSLVTQSMISTILTAQNFSMPAGYINDVEDNRFTVKVGNAFETLEQLKNLLLVDMKMDGVSPIYLRDVADVEINDNSADSYVRVNGNPAVMLQISKSSTASTSAVSDTCEETFKEIMENNPDVHVTVLMDQGVYIDMVVKSVLQNLVIGGILAIIVLALFLKDTRPTLIVAFSIPISLMFAVVLMYFSNVTLNVMSLSGLALAVGMLVDNSIVTIENIYRLRNLGYSKAQAAVSGAQQVAGAITASTLTTICVFLPIVFTQGLSRQLFTDMGLTIAYALVASLIIALTLVPALSRTVLKEAREAKTGFFAKLTDVYDKALALSMNNKWFIILLTTGLLAFSAYRATKMPLILIPSMDSTQMTMNYSLDEKDGWTEDDLIGQCEKIAEVVTQIDGVQTVGMTKGSSGISGMLGGSSNGLSMTFYVVLDEDKNLTNEEIADVIREKVPEYTQNLDITTTTMDMSSLTGSGITVTIKGNDLDKLLSEADKVARILEKVEGVSRVSDGSASLKEEVRIEVNKTRAMTHGLTVAQVYQLVATALTESTTATTLTLEGTDMKTIIHASSEYDLDTIRKLVVATEKEDDKDVDILLEDICSVYMMESPAAIRHDNQSRYRTVRAYIEKGYSSSLVARDIEKAMKEYEAPKGYSVSVGGENETTMDVMYDLIKMISLACVFIYLIMVAQFQSLLSPFIVIFTIPLAFTGGLLALLITGNDLSMIAMIGFLVLAGVVVNNGIVFVDYINQLRLEGMDKREAILQTGRDRIRPVLMTAMTTILANIVMATGGGMGADLSRGMAIVTVGGLAYATIITLFLVPALYDIFNRKEMRKVEIDDSL